MAGMGNREKPLKLGIERQDANSHVATTTSETEKNP